MDPRIQTYTSILDELPRGRLLDLACGQGLFSIIAQQKGWKVTAVDVRTARMPKTRGIKWIQSDVREFPINAGKYDAIALLGLLYHLELKDVIDLLTRCSHTLTVLDTHYSLNPDREELGYRGELFDEFQGRDPEEVKQKGLLSSWDNATSFWPDEGSLVKLLHDCGYEHVFKQSPPYRPDRAFFLCFPQGDHNDVVGRAWAVINGKDRRTERYRSIRRRVGKIVRRVRPSRGR
jgi:SAM-dependent methyltransferase